MENKTFEDNYNDGLIRGRKRAKKLRDMFPKPIARLIILVWMIMDIISGLICLLIHPIELVIRILITKFKNK